MDPSLISDLQSRLDALAEPSRKEWWERYLKGVIGFRGVDMAGIRGSVHDWYAGHGLGEVEVASRKQLAWHLIRCDQTEDKLAGVLLIQEILLPEGAIEWRVDLPVLASMFDDGHIYDWNTCDWLCVRVLGPLAEREGEACARAIADWRRAANLWRRRASGVAFVNYAGADRELFTGFRSMMLAICGTTVRDPERFAQTGTGWVLRELSKAEPSLVIEFVENNLGHMSREGVRYATAKLQDGEQARLLELHRAAQQRGI